MPRGANGQVTYSGQGLVEFALVLPLLLLLIFGVFDLASAVFTRNTLAEAALEGARAGIIMGNNDSAIRARVRTAAPSLHLADGQITIAPSPSRTHSQPVTVTVQYLYRPLTPVVGQMMLGGLPMSATAIMLVEGTLPY